MLKYTKTFENIQTLDCNFPVEDQFYVEEEIAVIADGITRDAVGNEDSNKYSFEEKKKMYPRPSGAELAARMICSTFEKRKGNESLFDLFNQSNENVRGLNQKYIRKCDYLKNDYYGAVASAIFIHDNILDYAYICDCGIIVYNLYHQIKFQTQDDKVVNSDEFIKQIGLPWNLPEARVIVRRDYRNRLDMVKDGRCVSYGAITGEKDALAFIRTGSISIDKGDIVVLYSDGFSNFLHESSFINYLFSNDWNSLESYIEQKSKCDYEKYGKEKTIIVYQI